jgi:putative chitinase
MARNQPNKYMELTSDQLSATAIYAGPTRIATYLPMINDTLDKYGIDNPMRVAHFLAQIIHESGSFVYTTELANGSAYEGRRDLGNTQPGDGPLYKGRGFIQLTGRANYNTYGNYLGVDLLSNPTLVATDYPADVAGWFWSTRNLNTMADADQLTNRTRVINGGTNGFDDRLKYLGLAKRALGLLPA